MPNFFVVGAAKSGTTSLHNYLDQHPQVSMSTVKEPNFFAFMDGVPDYSGPGAEVAGPILRDRLRREKYGFSITSWKEYGKLFPSSGSALAIGESSVSYMYFREAAERIKQYVPNARIIAILRNPVDRAYSKYLQFRRDGSEPFSDFEAAIRAESDRIRQNWSPTWFYIDRGFYYRQLKVYFELFGSKRVHVVLYDDFVNDPQRTLNGIFAFLGLQSCEINTARRHNVSRDFRVPRALWLHDLLMRPNPLSVTFRRVLPSSVVRAIEPYARRALFRKAEPLEFSPLSAEVRAALVDVFRDDILLLQDLLDRDLSIWL